MSRTALLLLLASSSVLAADKSYMTQASELAGIVETPVQLRDACIRRVPAMRALLRAEYANWQTRHAALLAAVAEELRRADAHARRQGSPFTLADLGKAGARQIEDRFATLAPGEAREVCAGYADFLREQDATMTTTVPRRLAALQASDTEPR